MRNILQELARMRPSFMLSIVLAIVGQNAKAGRMKTVAEGLRPPESLVLEGYAEMTDCVLSLVSIRVQEG